MKPKRGRGGSHSPLRFCMPAVFAAILCLMYGCASREVVEKAPVNSPDLEKVLFFPMKNMVRVYGDGEGVLSPFTGKYFMTGKVAESAEQFFSDQMIRSLKSRKGFLLLPASEAEGAKAQLLADGKTPVKEKSLLVKLGQEVGADAVVAGGIYRFEERVGARHSIESPASVAFEVCLISTVDGSILWSESYTETQISLSENLFELGAFIRRKGRWVTAEEMASYALEEMMRTFPE
jgi:hypothetical protein